mgnify:CR=1 FL=1
MPAECEHQAQSHTEEIADGRIEQAGVKQARDGRGGQDGLRGSGHRQIHAQSIPVNSPQDIAQQQNTNDPNLDAPQQIFLVRVAHSLKLGGTFALI